MFESARHNLSLFLTRKLFAAQPRVRELMLDTTTREDPYPFYEELLQQGDVVQDKVTTLAVGFEAVQSALRDNRLGHPDPDRQPGLLERFIAPNHYRGLVHPITPPSMISVNPPTHTQYRRLVQRAFNAKVVESMRPSVQSIADDLLDKVEGAPSFDVMVDFAAQLPVLVIADILGVPRKDHALFKAWGYDVARTLDLSMSWPEVQAAKASLRRLNDYFDEAIRQRRVSPRDDLLTALVEAEIDGDRLTREEVLATALLLLVAGFETTVNLIGNGVHALCSNPDQLVSVQARGEEGWRAAVEETLRFDAPVQMTGRVALEDTEVGGCAVKKGQPVLTIIAASNRDPRHTASPNVFDTERETIDHNAFAAGAHFCLGAPLSRIEGAVALQTLFTRRPDLDVGAYTRRPSALLRGFRTLQTRPTTSPVRLAAIG